MHPSLKLKGSFWLSFVRGTKPKGKSISVLTFSSLAAMNLWNNDTCWEIRKVSSCQDKCQLVSKLIILSLCRCTDLIAHDFGMVCVSVLSDCFGVCMCRERWLDSQYAE